MFVNDYSAVKEEQPEYVAEVDADGTILLSLFILLKILPTYSI